MALLTRDWPDVFSMPRPTPRCRDLRVPPRLRLVDVLMLRCMPKRTFGSVWLELLRLPDSLTVCTPWGPLPEDMAPPMEPMMPPNTPRQGAWPTIPLNLFRGGLAKAGASTRVAGKRFLLTPMDAFAAAAMLPPRPTAMNAHTPGPPAPGPLWRIPSIALCGWAKRLHAPILPRNTLPSTRSAWSC